MVKGKIPVVQYRRKANGRTDYRKRLRLLLSGKERLVVRFSGNSITAQIVRYEQTGDAVISGVNSRSLTKQGWKFGLKNMPAAYLTGLLLAQKAQKAGYNQELILDTGFLTIQRQGRLFAVLRGVIDGGLLVKVGDEGILPTEETVSGARIAEYATLLAKDTEAYKRQFSKCLANGADPTKITDAFAKLKQEILG